MQMPEFSADFWQKLEKLIDLNKRLEAIYDETVDDYWEEVAIHRGKLQEEVVPVVLPLVELMVAAGVVRAECHDENDKFFTFRPHSAYVYPSGAIHLNCRRIVGSSLERPKFTY